MSVISSTFNDSLSLISYSLPLKIQCLIYRPRSLIFISFSITIILLLLCTLILYYVLQQWWRGHSVFSALTASQSDSFIYHIVTMELIYSFGCILICFANYNQDLNILLVGALMYLSNWFGETSHLDLCEALLGCWSSHHVTEK